MKTTPEKISELMWAHAATSIWLSSVELGIYSAIRDGNTKAESIAKATRCSEHGMRMLLDALVGLGLVSRVNSEYGLTPEAETFLVESSPMYLGSMVPITKVMVQEWLDLSAAVRAGKPRSPRPQDDRAKFFAQLIRGLFPLNYPVGKYVAERKLLGSFKRVLDVALGSAAWSIPLAEADSSIHVTGVDFPEVIAVTQEFLNRHGVARQFSFIEGDLREVDFGQERFDLVILGHICHSEGEPGTRHLLRKSFRALVSGGRVFIAEFVPNEERTGPPQPLIFALNMLLHTDDGQTFTLGELSSMLQDAGFKPPRTLETPAPSPLIVAEK